MDHRLLGATDKPLLARCDSFVVERNVHFPTDISLLFDALCKAIHLTAQSCKRLDIGDWRQSGYNIRQLKKALRKAQQSKKVSSKIISSRHIKPIWIKHSYT